MIWLRKKQDDMQSNSLPNTMIKYFKDGMETFDQYYSRICKLKNDLINADDIIFHLDQLMDIAIHCKLFSDWFSKTTEKERVKYFMNLSDIDFIRKNADYHFHFSKNRLDEVGKKIINVLDNSFDDFCRELSGIFLAYTNDVEKMELFKPKYPQTCFYISFILQSNLLTHIRLTPQPYVLFKFEDCNYTYDIPDFVNYTLFRLDDNYSPKEEIKNTTIELLNLSNECLDDFIKLAGFYMEKKQKSTSEQVIINIQQNINNPEFNYKTFSTTYHNEFFNFECEKEKQYDENLSENDIFKNITFNTFCNISPNFYKIWECLSSKGYLFYDGEFIQRNKETFPEYCINLLAHEGSLLKVSFRVAHSYFKKLFNYKDINKISVPDKFSRPAWLDILNLISNL